MSAIVGNNGCNVPLQNWKQKCNLARHAFITKFIVTVLRSHRILPGSVKGLEKVERDIVFLDRKLNIIETSFPSS